MGQDSKIEWTHHTFNPWHGCAKVSEGCKNCYAETLSHRWGFEIWGANAERRFFKDKHWQEPLKWNEEARKAGESRRVFCGSMCDVFEDRPDLTAQRERLYELIWKTPYLDWLLLTKRPENILRMIPADWHKEAEAPFNLWLGTSVENTKALKRIEYLNECSNIAKVTFLSCEPLLEEIDLKGKLKFIDWVIVGGESGHGKRPFNADWARKIQSDCKETATVFFMKQMDKVQPIPDDLMIREFPVTLVNNF